VCGLVGIGLLREEELGEEFGVEAMLARKSGLDLT
jgi:hypothetical protein